MSNSGISGCETDDALPDFHNVAPSCSLLENIFELVMEDTA